MLDNHSTTVNNSPKDGINAMSKKVLHYNPSTFAKQISKSFAQKEKEREQHS